MRQNHPGMLTVPGVFSSRKPVKSDAHIFADCIKYTANIYSKCVYLASVTFSWYVNIISNHVLALFWRIFTFFQVRELFPPQNYVSVAGCKFSRKYAVIASSFNSNADRNLANYEITVHRFTFVSETWYSLISPYSGPRCYLRPIRKAAILSTLGHLPLNRSIK